MEFFMQQLIARSIVISLLAWPLWSYANVDPSKLVKVTPETNPDCVEYFNYKDAMYCSTTPLASAAVDPHLNEYEKQNIVFDERPWQAAWGKKTPIITTIEYVPLGDDVEKWHELITSEFIPGLQDKATPKEFALASIQGIKEAGFNPIVTFIKDTPTQVVLEFRIESPTNAIQDELQVINKGKDGLYVLHYVIKQADMGKKNRDKWLAILEKATVK
jgi:hypothetical protein